MAANLNQDNCIFELVKSCIGILAESDEALFAVDLGILL